MKHQHNKYAKYAGVAVLLFVPSVLFAQSGSDDLLMKLASFEDQSNLLKSLSLWSTLIIAFVTSGMVWFGGRKMHGGVFGSVLTFFSIGMTLVFLGFATEVPWLSGIDSLYLKLVHDSLYIAGYIFMGLAASKLLRVIKGE